KASNAYTNFVVSGVANLSSSIPAVARITAMEAIVDYRVDALIRSKDFDVPDVTNSNYNVAFDIVQSGNIKMLMLDGDGTSYTKVGTEYSVPVTINRVDY